MVIVNHIGKFLLEWKRLEITPIHLSFLSFENENLIVKFKNLRGFSGNIRFVFLNQSTQYYNIVWVKAKGVVVGDSHSHSNLKLGPDSKLCVVSFNRVKEYLLASAWILSQTAENVDMFWSTFASCSVDTRCYQLLMFVFVVTAQLPFSSSDLKCLKTSQKPFLRIISSNHIYCIHWVVSTYSRVLATNMHVVCYRKLAFFVNYKAAVASDA